MQDNKVSFDNVWNHAWQSWCLLVGPAIEFFSQIFGQLWILAFAKQNNKTCQACLLSCRMLLRKGKQIVKIQKMLLIAAVVSSVNALCLWAMKDFSREIWSPVKAG